MFNSNQIAEFGLRQIGRGSNFEHQFLRRRVHGKNNRLLLDLCKALPAAAQQQSFDFSQQNAAMETFGERLRGCRKAAGLSQEQAAKKIGVTQGLISGLERGEYTESAHTLALAKLYGVNPQWLADGTGNRADLPLSPEEAKFLADFRRLRDAKKDKLRVYVAMEADIDSQPEVTQPRNTSAPKRRNRQ